MRGTQILEKLQGKTFKANDANSTYAYTFAVCAAAEPSVSVTSGLVQRSLKSPKRKPVSIGSFKQADLFQGTNWLSLEYAGGQNYNSHCGKEPRQAIIMMTCNVKQEKFRVIEENAGKSAHCYYLFELEHPLLCPSVSTSSNKNSLSFGSILLIIFFVVLISYLMIGCLFKRCAKSAVGWEQLPHFSFWRTLGNLFADGVDVVFRHEKRPALTFSSPLDDPAPSHSYSRFPTKPPTHTNLLHSELPSSAPSFDSVSANASATHISSSAAIATGGGGGVTAPSKMHFIPPQSGVSAPHSNKQINIFEDDFDADMLAP